MGAREMTSEDIALAEENIHLSKVYREAFGFDGNGPTGSGKQLYDDLLQFCGLMQAKAEGSSSEIIKAMGRVEVLGRINFFLNLPHDKVSEMQEVIANFKGDGK
jgi:hypothetical protein